MTPGGAWINGGSSRSTMHERSMTVRCKVASAAADEAHVACEHGPTRILRCSFRTIIVGILVCEPIESQTPLVPWS